MERLDQERKKTEPARTEIHPGKNITIKYPMIAKILKNKSAFLYPNRVEIYPPGNE